MAPPRLRFMVRRPVSGHTARRPPWVYSSGCRCPAPRVLGPRGPPIIRQPSNSTGSRTLARLAKTKKTENPPEPWSAHGGARREQPFHPLDLEAGVACPLVEFDPRHALVPNLYFQHGALHSAHTPTASEGAGRFITLS